jgi:CheY-like chemotaxis protein
LKGLSVLLVEDDDGVRRAVGRLLERLEMTVTSFTSGDDALGYLQQPLARHVDLLVTDIRMPGMDGYEVADHCRRILTDVPIIFMTGYDPDANDRKRPRNSVLLTKPVGIREFLTAANELQRPTGDENELLLPG